MTITTSTVSSPEWDSIRDRFRSSMMVETEIHKLAQNLDLSWPLRGKDEVPLKYLGLTLDEMMMMPGIGDHPERIRLLVEILNETMAFDDPFGEMAEHIDSSSKKDDGAERALEKMGISLEFPLDLCALSPETREFCGAEEIRTLGQFLSFGSNMAQNIVVGGDFRAFLNALAQPEEATIARYLPYRPGKTGLHLAETISHLFSHFDPSEHAFLYDSAQAPMTAEQRRETRRLTEGEQIATRAKVRERFEIVFNWFEGARAQLEDAFAEGRPHVERMFIPLESPAREKVCVWLCAFVLGLDQAPPPSKRGFFARLFGR